jgi:hypothetical protein
MYQFPVNSVCGVEAHGAGGDAAQTVAMVCDAACDVYLSVFAMFATNGWVVRCF